MKLLSIGLPLVAATAGLLALRSNADESTPPVEFAGFEKIDCHVHLRYAGPEVAALARESRFRLIDISTNNFDIAWQAGLARRQRAHFPGTVEHVTAFSMKGFTEPWWTAATIKQLDRSFTDDHAIGVKIWKDVGTQYRAPNGDYILIDDPRFTPLFDHLEKKGTTLVLHIADPIEFWQSPETIEHPGRRRLVEAGGLWVMHGKEGVPSHAELIAARDRVLANHPDLKIIGAHLGSLEHSLEEIGKRLDAYPNFAIDTAARMPDLLRFDREDLRAFIIRYQDRILYGTDMPVKPHHNGENKRDQLQVRWERDWKLLASEEEVEVTSNAGTKIHRGLALPRSVMEKVYHDNALAWFPALQANDEQVQDLIPKDVNR
jgi:predicted TIM-barrel fold metal-dependent hydrolase